ncbi:unnamed protein product, partial [Allacma fusca]
NKTTVRFC